jgi:hypothetical protein
VVPLHLRSLKENRLMRQSSECVAGIGAALAKAQAELTNPEKTLVGNIAGNGGATMETFRYASLASGLEIVRKTLSKHEIATVQTTDVDAATRTVQLTTMFVHSSGEWLASVWPVCSVSDVSHPRRMGASLTYARRYSLFALAGIAGEDDLDAPDLPSQPISNGHEQHASASSSVPVRVRKRNEVPSSRRADLSPEESSVVRDKMLIEIAALTSPEAASRWAEVAIQGKNELSRADADSIEKAFEARLMELGERDGGQVASPSVQPGNDKPDVGERSARIDKSVLAFPELKRIRNRAHLRHVAGQACLVCARSPSDAHHLRFAQSRALGRKVSDEFTVPLCRIHHREVHGCGDEPGWWKSMKIDPLGIARRLWMETAQLPHSSISE